MVNYSIMNPRISEFFGIKVYMYFEDHNPPHFHVIYNEFECFIDIETLMIIEWKLPKKVEKLVTAWAELYQDELREDWNLIKQWEKPIIIEPL
jgi:Domain of unknown function (DUF4160)